MKVRPFSADFSLTQIIYLYNLFNIFLSKLQKLVFHQKYVLQFI